MVSLRHLRALTRRRGLAPLLALLLLLGVEDCTSRCADGDGVKGKDCSRFNNEVRRFAATQGLSFTEDIVQQEEIANRMPAFGAVLFSPYETDLTGIQVHIRCRITVPEGVDLPKRIEVEIEAKEKLGDPDLYQDSMKLRIKANGECRPQAKTLAPGAIAAENVVLLLYRPIGAALQVGTRLHFEVELS